MNNFIEYKLRVVLTKNVKTVIKDNIFSICVIKSKKLILVSKENIGKSNIRTKSIPNILIKNIIISKTIKLEKVYPINKSLLIVLEFLI